MTLPAESQVGRRAQARRAPRRAADGWSLQTGSGLQASYGKGSASRGPSYSVRLRAQYLVQNVYAGTEPLREWGNRRLVRGLHGEYKLQAIQAGSHVLSDARVDQVSGRL